MLPRCSVHSCRGIVVAVLEVLRVDRTAVHRPRVGDRGRAFLPASPPGRSNASGGRHRAVALHEVGPDRQRVARAVSRRPRSSAADRSPTHTPTTIDEEKPTNHASLKSSVVPGLAAGRETSRPAAAPTSAVPRSMTSREHRHHLIRDLRRDHALGLDGVAQCRARRPHRATRDDRARAHREPAVRETSRTPPSIASGVTSPVPSASDGTSGRFAKPALPASFSTCRDPDRCCSSVAARLFDSISAARSVSSSGASPLDVPRRPFVRPLRRDARRGR